MTTEDDAFVALGPSPVGFFTYGANIDWGSFLIGHSWGVVTWGGGAGPTPGPSFKDGGGIWSLSDQGPGIVGTSGKRFGVFGQAGEAGEPTGPAGVCGTSQRQIGVIGSSSTNVAVFGQANRFIGVYGTSNESIGVRGESAGSGPAFGGGGDAITPAGVVGTSVPSPGIVGTSEKSFGVAGQSGKSGMVVADPAALFGTSADSIAISGISNHNIAVRGIALGSDAILGLSVTGYGVRGLSFAPAAPGTPPSQVPAGAYGESTNGGFGVLGVTSSTSTSPGAGITGVCMGNGFGVFGYNPNPAAYAGYFGGKVHATDEISAPVKNAIVPFPDGSKRLLHCMESPEHWFEDFGSAQLKRGRATVKLDADFAKVVTLDSYRVFLTPEGDCNGLYVRSKRGTTFEVRELQLGTSSVTFGYRVVAKRKDIKRHIRFAKIETPVFPMPAGKTPAARGRKPPRLPASMRPLLATLEKEARKKRR